MTLAAATVYVHKDTRVQCAAGAVGAVKAEGAEADAAQSARQSDKGASALRRAPSGGPRAALGGAVAGRGRGCALN